jgi:hypothetical protein
MAFSDTQILRIWKQENKFLAPLFRNILIGDGKDEKMMNDVMGEWYEFKVTVQLPLLDCYTKLSQ